MMGLDRRAVAAGALLGVAAALPAAAAEQTLSTTGVWKIVLNLNNDTSFNRCIMQAGDGPRMLRLASDGKTWSLSLPASGHRNKAQGTLGFDQNQPEFFSFEANRERAWVGVATATVQLLARSKTVEVNVGGKDQRWAIAGAGEAVKRVNACVKQYKF